MGIIKRTGEIRPYPAISHFRSTPMRKRSWEVSRKKRYSEDHRGWTFHPISLSSIETYSVSWLGARTAHRCCIVCRASTPPVLPDTCSPKMRRGITDWQLPNGTRKYRTGARYVFQMKSRKFTSKTPRRRRRRRRRLSPKRHISSRW